MVRLSVHDLMTMKKGESPEDVYERTRQFVQAIDQFNYTRYWFAEHHNSPYYTSVSPELMVAHIAALTKNLRIGTGGTMIMHYSPLKIAENFKTLEAMAPGRIDLGIGRAPGSGEAEITALSQGQPFTYTDMYDEIEIILNYLQDKKNTGFYGQTQAMPTNIQQLPQAWMLGSSGASADKAAELGLAYSFAKFFGIRTEADVFHHYRKTFQPSAFFDRPEIGISYIIVVADSQEEAWYHFKPIAINMLSVKAKKPEPIRDPEEVKDYTFSDYGETYIKHYLDHHFMIVGNKKQVEEKLQYEIDTYGIDEIMVYSPIYDDQARLDSYRKLAEIFNL